MVPLTPEEEHFALGVLCPICEAPPGSPCDPSFVYCDELHIGRVNLGKETEKQMALKNKRSTRGASKRNSGTFDPDEWNRKRQEWDAELEGMRRENGLETTSGSAWRSPESRTGTGGGKGWKNSLPPPKPWEWWETGLPQVVAGRQLLYAKDAAQLVQETGVTHVLDLREPKEWKPPFLGEAALAHLLGAGVVLRNVPMTDASRMPEKKLEEAVRFIREAVASGGKAYIHCRAGKERTGAVLFAYAVSTGLAPEAAYGELRKHCKEFRPMYSQMEACFRLLKLAGVLPCYDCGRPLSVSPEVGMCRCLGCSKHFKTTSYLKVTSQGTAVGSGKPPPDSGPEAPPEGLCWHCGVEFAATAEGLCPDCDSEQEMGWRRP